MNLNNDGITCGKLVQNDPKLPNGGGELPNLKEEVNGSISGNQIFSLFDRKIMLLALACRPSIANKQINK